MVTYSDDLVTDLFRFALSKPFKMECLKAGIETIQDLVWNYTFFKLHGDWPVEEIK